MAGTESEIESHEQDFESESNGRSIDSDESEINDPHECNETVDPDVRADVLEIYNHRCQTCGRRGPQKGGLATLHVHHIERDPDGIGEHDLENLTLLCRPCHSWLHQQSTPDDSPVELTEADRSVLLPQDIEILRYLAEHGPSRTGDIAAGLTSDLSVAAIRERLWVLMSLDNRVEARERQIVDKDVETNEWGLADQVEASARGHIPDDKQLLLQRMEDEQVRQALERGCERRTVADVFGCSRRTTFNKMKRALAYDFPLDAFGRGGRPSEDGRRETDSDATDTTTARSTDADQQQLDAVGESADGTQGRTDTREAAVDSDRSRSTVTAGQSRGDESAVDSDELAALWTHLQALAETVESLDGRDSEDS